MMGLFRLGDFTLSSGTKSPFKIDCDALGQEDWEALAWYAHLRLPPFSRVVSVPTGGDKFAAAMQKYVVKDASTWLITDDVLTTGRSMERTRSLLSSPNVIGCVVFARGECPGWIVPLFAAHVWDKDADRGVSKK